VTHSLEEYEACALAAGHRAVAARQIPRPVAAEQVDLSLFDGNCYRRQIEATTRAMWELLATWGETHAPPASASSIISRASSLERRPFGWNSGLTSAGVNVVIFPSEPRKERTRARLRTEIVPYRRQKPDRLRRMFDRARNCASLVLSAAVRSATRARVTGLTPVTLARFFPRGIISCHDHQSLTPRCRTASAAVPLGVPRRWSAAPPIRIAASGASARSIQPGRLLEIAVRLSFRRETFRALSKEPCLVDSWVIFTAASLQSMYL